MSIAWPIPIFEDFAKAMSAILAAHFESSRSALRTILLSHKDVSHDAFTTTHFKYFTTGPSQLQLPLQVLDDNGKILNDRLAVLWQHARQWDRSSSFSDYFQTACECHDESRKTCNYFIDQIGRALTTRLSPIVAMDFFVWIIINGKLFGIVTSIDLCTRTDQDHRPSIPQYLPHDSYILSYKCGRHWACLCGFRHKSFARCSGMDW